MLKILIFEKILLNMFFFQLFNHPQLCQNDPSSKHFNKQLSKQNDILNRKTKLRRKTQTIKKLSKTKNKRK